MATPYEDFSKRSMEEVLVSIVENRAWGKELRNSTRELVSSRLAKEIGAEEYAVSRRLTNDHVAECRRQSILLMNEVRAREGKRDDLQQPILKIPSNVTGELQVADLNLPLLQR